VGHDIVIEVDPGMAFGTGQHASTRMCLEALETVLLQEKDGNRWEVLDIGSGTGILGIAAAKLGAEKVLCVDIDTQATQIARDNIRINLVESQVEAVTQDVAQLHRSFHLIVANLTANPLIQLRPHILSLLVPGGFLIISGIVEQSRSDIETHFFSEPLVPLRTLVEKEWLCYLFRKEADSP
jgi:ribosomal protein L11 methyltransferase